VLSFFVRFNSETFIYLETHLTQIMLDGHGSERYVEENEGNVTACVRLVSREELDIVHVSVESKTSGSARGLKLETRWNYSFINQNHVGLMRIIHHFIVIVR